MENSNNKDFNNVFIITIKENNISITFIKMPSLRSSFKWGPNAACTL